MVRIPQCTCPKAQALFTLLGKKWIIFIMQAVDEGACTFTEIGKSVGWANTKILTDRLHELVEIGILKKNTENGKYCLSPLGKELSHRLIDLSHWWGSQKK
jgi:DNA-binding HxlR family transcriptional regulator